MDTDASMTCCDPQYYSAWGSMILETLFDDIVAQAVSDQLDLP